MVDTIMNNKPKRKKFKPVVVWKRVVGVSEEEMQQKLNAVFDLLLNGVTKR